MKGTKDKQGKELQKLQSNYSEAHSPQGAYSDAACNKSGRWSMDEHFRFIEALQLFGKEWKRVQQHVGSRSSTQARSHAQKFFVKLEKRGQRLEDFL